MLKFDFIEGLIGANYKWWTHGSWEDGSPFFTKSYSIEDIFQKGINCAGLVNVFLHENQKQIPIIANYPGGTFAYYKVYKNILSLFHNDLKIKLCYYQ